MNIGEDKRGKRFGDGEIERKGRGGGGEGRGEKGGKGKIGEKNLLDHGTF